MKFLLMFVMFGALAMAQDAQKPVEPLTDAETLKAIPVLREMAELRDKYTQLQLKLEAVRQEVIKARSLDPKKSTINWDTGKIVPITQ